MPPASFVVVIDDSPTIRNILETCLKQAGYSGATFPDGLQTMRWFLAHPTCSPDVIFIDIHLPHIDGYEVLSRLRNNGIVTLPQTRIIILSRQDSVIDTLKSRLAHAHLHLTKPFTLQDILAAIEDQLRQRVEEATLQRSEEAHPEPISA